jgi:hypothetical protein
MIVKVTHSMLQICTLLILVFTSSHGLALNSTMSRILTESDPCDSSISSSEGFKDYFADLSHIYSKGSPLGDKGEIGTCLQEHKKCGWASPPTNKDLPLLVISVGLEGAGHHLWTELMEKPVFDCVWINARHYKRDIGDGVARTTPELLEKGFREQFAMRKQSGKPMCKSIYDAEDSFPTGAIRKTGRIFMSPDLVNLQKLDGKLFRIKYLIILRNVTDTAMSAFRRNFFSEIDTGLRTVEHTMIYIQAALQNVPCHQIFLAHYEHVLHSPHKYIEPLAKFMELNSINKQMLKRRLDNLPGKGKFPNRKTHKLTQYPDCKKQGLGGDLNACYKFLEARMARFFNDRAFMWPTFAGDGFSLKE